MNKTNTFLSLFIVLASKIPHILQFGYPLFFEEVLLLPLVKHEA